MKRSPARECKQSPVQGPESRSFLHNWLQWSGSGPRPQEREEAAAGQCQHWLHKCALQGGSLKPESHSHNSLGGPRKTDKNGVAFLDTDSGSGCGWNLSVFCRREEPRASGSPLPQIGQHFNKDFFLLHQSLFYACVPQ